MSKGSGSVLAVEGRLLTNSSKDPHLRNFRSYSGYGKIGFDRRFRVYDILDYGESIKTYKRTDKDEIVDEMVLVGKGAPPPYEGL